MKKKGGKGLASHSNHAINVQRRNHELGRHEIEPKENCPTCRLIRLEKEEQ